MEFSEEFFFICFKFQSFYNLVYYEGESVFDYILEKLNVVFMQGLEINKDLCFFCWFFLVVLKQKGNINSVGIFSKRS